MGGVRLSGLSVHAVNATIGIGDEHAPFPVYIDAIEIEKVPGAAASDAQQADFSDLDRIIRRRINQNPVLASIISRRDVKVPDWRTSEVGIGSEETVGCAIIIARDDHGKDSVLNSKDRTDVSIVLPHSAFIRRMRDMRMSVAANPSQVNGARNLTDRFADVVLSDAYRRVLTAGATRNVEFIPGKAVVFGNGDAIYSGR